MLYLLPMLLAYCGVESDELEGMTLPAHMFVELEETNAIESNSALIWFAFEKKTRRTTKADIKLGKQRLKGLK